MDQPGVPGDDAKASAMVNIKVGEVEGKDVKKPPVDYQQFVVIPHQIVGGPRNRDAHCKQPHLKLAQAPEGRRIFSRMTVLENLQMGALIADKAEFAGDLEVEFCEGRLHDRPERLRDTLNERIAATPAEGVAEVLYGLGSAIGTDEGSELPAGYLRLAVYLDPSANLPLLALGDLAQGAHRCAEAVAHLSTVTVSAAAGTRTGSARCW